MSIVCPPTILPSNRGRLRSREGCARALLVTANVTKTIQKRRFILNSELLDHCDENDSRVGGQGFFYSEVYR